MSECGLYCSCIRVVFLMNYKRNNKRFSVKGRGEYMSHADFILSYYADPSACRHFFIDMKWPNGFICEECGCTEHYVMSYKNRYRCAHCGHDHTLLSHTIFQHNRLPLNVLLYGLFLVFTSCDGISSVELAKELKVNYKTACLLQSKCRILMHDSNASKMLDSQFYESDVAYTGTPSKNGKRGLGTDKQPFLIVLATQQENQYPSYVKIKEIDKDTGMIIKDFFEQNVVLSLDKKLNTDGKSTYNILKEQLTVQNEKINYEDDDHRLYFLNKIVSNLNSMLVDVFHGITKRMLPLYYGEYEWRFNHRHTKDMLSKIKKYVRHSDVHTRKMIK